MVSIVFSRDSWGLRDYCVTHKYPLYRAYIGISHKGTLVGVHPNISNYPLIIGIRYSKYKNSGGDHECCFFQTTPCFFNVDIPIYHNFSKGFTIFSTPPPLEQAWNPKNWCLVDVSLFLRVPFFRELPLLETNISPANRHFWVDDFPNFPFGGICDSSVKGTIFSIHVSTKTKGKTSRFRGIKALHRNRSKVLRFPLPQV